MTPYYYSGEKSRDLQTVINNDLNVYYRWLLCNRLKINIEKTKFMLFKQKNKVIPMPRIKIKDVELQSVDSIKYLPIGLIIDVNLNWSEHITYVIKKMSSMIGALYKCRNYFTNKTRTDIYNAYFASHLRYLLPVWGTCGTVNFNRAQTIQNKIIKILFSIDRLTHTSDLYKMVNIFDIHKLLELEQCKHVYKVINKKQKCNTQIIFADSIHSYNTRQCDNIYQFNVHSNRGLNNPISQACGSYNRLPDVLKNCNIFPKFVRLLNSHIGIK